jgi:hypothetical protein
MGGNQQQTGQSSKYVAFVNSELLPQQQHIHETFADADSIGLEQL